MTEAIINWLKNADRYEISGRGVVFTGPAPFTFDKNKPDEMDRLMKRPWVISHPEAAGKLWRVKTLESYCIFTIHEGTPIGLVVEEWKE